MNVIKDKVLLCYVMILRKVAEVHNHCCQNIAKSGPKVCQLQILLPLCF